MGAKHGNLSINSENIFPIIKKWMYSDHDIFVRELISNGCDAITKLKKLDMMGEYQLPDDYKASIKVCLLYTSIRCSLTVEVACSNHVTPIFYWNIVWR